jgi:hypothetical protein
MLNPYFLKHLKAKKPSPSTKEDRNRYVFVARSGGMSYQDIGDVCGISRERVVQIFESELKYKYYDLKLKGADIVGLNNNEVFALADYLRHQLAVEYPMEQYFIEKAAKALEDLANERAELKHQVQLITTPVIVKN